MEQDKLVYAGIGIAFLALLLFLRWRWRKCRLFHKKRVILHVQKKPQTLEELDGTVHLVHRLCPHSNVVQSYEVEQKDSLDEHLDVLTRKLAEKEGRLRLSKTKIRQTQNEIENLHAIDQDVRTRYRDIMDSLRKDLLLNEKECKKLQEQIEWVSRRRAELKEEVRRGQRLYGEAATELANNLAELQRGRGIEKLVIEKPQDKEAMGIRYRKEPYLPRASVGSIVTNKSNLGSPETLSLKQYQF